MSFDTESAVYAVSLAFLTLGPAIGFAIAARDYLRSGRSRK